MPILNWETPQTPDDWGKWNAKLVNKTTTRPHIEIRTTRNNQDILVAVSLTGEMKLQFGSKAVEQCNVRLSSNLPIKLSLQDWEELRLAVKEALRKLKKLQDEVK